jgi:hypothetical protein
MTADVKAEVPARQDPRTAVAGFVSFLETGIAPGGLFAPDVFADVSLPRWRVQSDTSAGILAIRAQGHPSPGRVRVTRVERMDQGFTLEFGAVARRRPGLVLPRDGPPTSWTTASSTWRSTAPATGTRRGSASTPSRCG